MSLARSPSPQPSVSKLPVNFKLKEQGWYWGPVSKEEIALAMANKPEGTFTVRDSTVPGDYTITLRQNFVNNLIKIIVDPITDRCGFTPEECVFDTVVDLVKHYTTASLSEHSSKLKTNLKLPLDKWFDEEKDAAFSCEQEEREDPLTPERVVSMLKMSKDKLHGKASPEYKETGQVIERFMENLVVERERTKRRKKTVDSNLEKIAHKYVTLKKELKGYENFEKIFKSKEEILQNSINETRNTNKTKHDKAVEDLNTTKEKMEKLTTSKLKVLDRYNALLALQNGLKKERAKLEEAVFTVDRRFIHYNVLLVNNGCDRNYFRRIDTFMTEIAQKESDETVENCLKIELITSAFDWLSVNPNKDYGIGIVKQSIKYYKEQKKNPNGIFLIRPSTSCPGSYALIVSNEDNVYSCLIDYRPHTEDGICEGYGFKNVNMYHTTLTDFVRYYSVVKLAGHNANLKTCLRIPALRLMNAKMFADRSMEFYGEKNRQLEVLPLLPDYFSVDHTMYFTKVNRREVYAPEPSSSGSDEVFERQSTESHGQPLVNPNPEPLPTTSQKPSSSTQDYLPPLPDGPLPEPFSTSPSEHSQESGEQQHQQGVDQKEDSEDDKVEGKVKSAFV